MAPKRELPVIRPLVDAQQREISYLRVSLTDRCNYRCTYCMPAEGVELLPRQEILEFEEIERLVGIFADMGVEKVRLTGGEPTIRRRVVDLVARIKAVPGIRKLVMTSNAHRFPELARPLADAGLDGVNVSLDTLDPETFRELTLRGDLSRVLDGVDAALAAGIEVKLNAVALRAVNGDALGAICEYSWQRGIMPRFIEHMPMSDARVFAGENHLPAAEIRSTIGEHFGAEVTVADSDSPTAGPARYFRVGETDRTFGIISALSEHFCDTCNRVRLTATGELHTCLAFDDAVNLRELCRGDAEDEQIKGAIKDALMNKRAGHEFHTSGAGAPKKHMVSIGG